MPMLGDLLAAARDSAGNFEAWLGSADPRLSHDLREAAEANRVTPTAFVRMSVADFSRFAGEDDWATLVSSIRNGDDPGTACVLAMVDWRLSAPTCSSHRADIGDKDL